MSVNPIVHKKIAYWWFEDKRRIIKKENREELINLLNMCKIVLEVLEKYQLLIPNKIVFNSWIKPGIDNSRLDDQDLIIEIPKSDVTTDIINLCKRALEEIEEKQGFMYPINIYIEGEGIIYDKNGEKQTKLDVTAINATTFMFHIVRIITTTDAWLPYSLTAKPQFEVYEKNAPRLENALQEIQEKLGVEALNEEYNKCVEYDGFHLKNKEYGDGEIAPARRIPLDYKEIE